MIRRGACTASGGREATGGTGAVSGAEGAAETPQQEIEIGTEIEIEVGNGVETEIEVTEAEIEREVIGTEKEVIGIEVIGIGTEIRKGKGKESEIKREKGIEGTIRVEVSTGPKSDEIRHRLHHCHHHPRHRPKWRCCHRRCRQQRALMVEIGRGRSLQQVLPCSHPRK